MNHGVPVGLLVAALCVGACKKEEANETSASSALVAQPAPAASIAPDMDEAQEEAEVEKPEPQDESDEPGGEDKTRTEKTGTEESNEEQPKKRASGGPAAILDQCCLAIDAAAKKGGRTKNQYSAAHSVCKGLAEQLKAGKANLTSARTTLRAQLQGVPLPGGC